MFAGDLRTSAICPANLSVAALPVVPFAVLSDADGEIEVAVFVLARIALRCPERCAATVLSFRSSSWTARMLALQRRDDVDIRIGGPRTTRLHDYETTGAVNRESGQYTTPNIEHRTPKTDNR